MRAFMENSIKKDEEFLSSLLDTVAYVRLNYPMGKSTNWKIVKDIMSELFPNRKHTRESVRNRYRRLTDLKVNQITKRKDDRVSGRNTFEKRLLAEIKRKRPLEYLIDRLDTTEEVILASVAKLQLQGFRGVAVFNEDGTVFVHNRVRSNQKEPSQVRNAEGYKIDVYDEEVIVFGVVSDTHFGNMCADKKSLGKFYKEMSLRGIDTVLHAGDISDGYYTNRPTSILEQYAVGFSAQLKDVVKDYPKVDGITTYFITGNHDATHLRNGFADIGEAVSAQRDDLVYLGHNFARVKLGNATVSLIHPTDGVSQNFNKKIRDIIEGSPERRSDLMLIGHYHKLAMLHHNEVYGYLLPSFEKRTTFMQDNGIDSITGGYVFTLIMKSGKVDRVISEVIKY